jgi:cell wall-associated NlpC family hydrolase
MAARRRMLDVPSAGRRGGRTLSGRRFGRPVSPGRRFGWSVSSGRWFGGRCRTGRGVAGGVAIALLAVLVVGVPGRAVAAPAVVAAVEVAAVDGGDLESVIEEYDHVTGLLSTDQAKAATLGATVTKLNGKVSLARSALQPAIRRIYELGSVSTLQLVIDSTSTQALVDQLALAQTLAHQFHEQITTLTTTVHKDHTAITSLNKTIATLATRKADLANKKRTILAALAAQAKLPPTELHAPGSLAPVPCPDTTVSGAAAVAVKVACAQIGKPYIWAAAGPTSFDCSGLMVYAWGKAGVKLRHFTGWQWQDATPISRSQLRPGDLVFFYPPTHHHVGMYIGNGWMVNAPHTGDVVREARIDNLPIAGYRRP